MNTHRLAEQLITDEGLRLKVYDDKTAKIPQPGAVVLGKLTLGVGRNLIDRGITEDEALMLLDNDIKSFWGQIVVALPWVINAPEQIQEVLVNMAFNLGLGGLLSFKQTLSLIQAGRYIEAASAMLDSKWAGQVGERAKRLADTVRGCAQEG